MIDWSYDLLSENEKLLIRRLSIFMGGWTLEAAEQVCSDDSIHAEDVLDLLTHLVDKSLVVIDEQPTQLRYRMLETVRQYAREKLLESGEGEKLRNQHLAYFLKFAEEAEPHLIRKEQVGWFERLELDRENLRAALEWAVESENSTPPEAGLRLVNALKFFWQMRGYWIEGKEWSSRVLTNDENTSHTIALARAFASAAMFVYDDSKELIKLCDKGLALGRELGDKPSIAESLLIKGIEIRNQDDNLKGRALLQESLSIFRELDDKRGMARAIYNIGNTASNEYDFATARQYYEECLSLSQEVGDRRFTAISLMTLGGLLMNRGDWSASRKLYEESLSLGRELGDKHGMTMYLTSLGYLELGQGKYQQAQKLIEEGLVIAQELGSKLWIEGALDLMGLLFRYQNDYEKATKLQKEALSYSREVGYASGIATSLVRLGELARLQDDFATAYSFLSNALKIAKENNIRDVVAYCFEELAALNASQGQAKRATISFGAADALREVIHIVLLPVEKIEVDKDIAAARAQLDEASFNAAWAEGRAMKMEDAIEYALKELEP
jgi:tetratricopeptide (TPR) repeat protein